MGLKETRRAMKSRRRKLRKIERRNDPEFQARVNRLITLVAQHRTAEQGVIREKANCVAAL